MPKTLKLTRLDGRQDDCSVTLSLGFLYTPHTQGETCTIAWQVHCGGNPRGDRAASGRGRLLRQDVTKTGRVGGAGGLGDGEWGGGGGKATKVVATHSLRWVKSQALDGGSPWMPAITTLCWLLCKVFLTMEKVFFSLSQSFCIFHALSESFLFFPSTCFAIFSRCRLNNEIFDCWLFAVQCYSSSSMRVKVDRAKQNGKKVYKTGRKYWTSFSGT